MEEAFLDVRGLEQISGTPREIAVRLRREVRARERRAGRSRVGVATDEGAGEDGEPRGKAGRPARASPRTRRARSCTRFRWSALWGVGETTAEKLHDARHPHRRRACPPRRDRARTRSWARHAARHLHAIAHNRDPRRVRPGQAPRLDRLTVRARQPPALPRRARRPCSSRWSTGSRGACAPRAAPGRTVTLRLRFGDFTRATRSRTLPHPAAGTGSILAARARCCSEGSRRDRAPRDHPAGHRGQQPGRERLRRAARAASRRTSRTRPSTPRSTRSATASAPTPSAGRRRSAASARCRRGCAPGRNRVASRESPARFRKLLDHPVEATGRSICGTWPQSSKITSSALSPIRRL